MDIKAQVQKIVDTLTGDKELLEKFKDDPKGTVEKLVSGADSDTVEKIADAVKPLLESDAGEKISDALGGLFGKKDD